MDMIHVGISFAVLIIGSNQLNSQSTSARGLHGLSLHHGVLAVKGASLLGRPTQQRRFSTLLMPMPVIFAIVPTRCYAGDAREHFRQTAGSAEYEDEGDGPVEV
jgi:hypothetical protein